MSSMRDPKNVCLIRAMYEYVSFRDKGELGLQIHLRWLLSCVGGWCPEPRHCSRASCIEDAVKTSVSLRQCGHISLGRPFLPTVFWEEHDCDFKTTGEDGPSCWIPARPHDGWRCTQSANHPHNWSDGFDSAHVPPDSSVSQLHLSRS